MAPKKKTTIDDLARMTQEGFSSLQNDMNGRFTDLRTEMHEGFAAVDARLEKVEQRLDRIENILLRAHENRIEKLEDQVRMLLTANARKASR